MAKWKKRAEAVAEKTREALQLVYDILNHGQQEKLLKDEAVRVLLERYGVQLEE